MLALVLVWPLAACGSAGNGSSTVPPAGEGVPSTAPAAPGVSGSPASPATPATPSAPKSSAPRATALEELGGFITRAASMDRALRSAAVLVNAGITAQTINVSARAFAAVDAINPGSLVSSLPGGMATRLKQQSLLVFSDLVARRCAYKRLQENRSEMPLPSLSRDGRMTLQALAEGAAPAARFAADLAALRSAASAAAAFTPAAPTARATAEIAVRTAYIIGRNSGCEESGGWVETELLPLVWRQSTDVFGRRTDGTIGGIVFRADYHAGDGWSVQLWAC